MKMYNLWTFDKVFFIQSINFAKMQLKFGDVSAIVSDEASINIKELLFYF